MAGFTGLGSDMGSIAKACAANASAPDTAMFLMAQQDAIREQAAKDRQEGKKAGSAPGGSKPSGGNAGKAVKGDAQAAYAAMKAALSNLK